MCAVFTWGSDGTRVNCEKKTRRFIILGNVLLGPGIHVDILSHYFNLMCHLPKHWCKPDTPLEVLCSPGLLSCLGLSISIYTVPCRSE